MRAPARATRASDVNRATVGRYSVSVTLFKVRG